MADIYGQLVAAQLEGLSSDPTAVAGRVYYETDTGLFKYYNSVAAAWRTLLDTATGTASVTTTRGDMIRRGAAVDERFELLVSGKILKSDGTDPIWAWPSTFANHTDASYTVLDNDGYSTFTFNITTGTDRTLTLPTAADNTGRVIDVVKIGSGTGAVIIDGEGAETVDGAAWIILDGQYESATIMCNGTAWYVINAHFTSRKSQTQSGGASVTSAWGDLTNITLTAGTWLVNGLVQVQLGTLSSPAWVQGGLGTASGTTTTGLASGDTTSVVLPPTANYDSVIAITPKHYTVAAGATQDIYLKGRASSAGTGTGIGRVTATKISFV